MMRCGFALVCGAMVIFTSGQITAAEKNRAAPRPSAVAEQLGRLYAEGVTAVKEKRWDEAIAKFTAALALNPKPKNAAKLYANRADAYVPKHDLERAESDARAAVRLDPNLGDGHLELGRIYAIKNQNEEAITEETRALELQPNRVAAMNNRAVAYAQLGKTKEALQDYNEVLRIDPKHVSAYVGRGAAYHEAGDLEHALADYNE